MAIKIGICGVGAFADWFIPLFQYHPDVKEVVLCDLDAAKLKEKSARFGITRTSPSLDDLCQSDVDAIAIFSQNDRHALQAVEALRSGKDVYSAVPSAISLEQIDQLVRTVEATGRIYMVGETSYYYPCAIYCRERHQKGDFGRIVYAEADYIHDMDNGLYGVYKERYGDEWKEQAGIPPLFYPTHSFSLLVSVTGARVTHVSSMGYEDIHEDGLFGVGRNAYDNPFSNETVLCRMSDGSMARVNEFRRVGHPGECRLSMFGTEASFEEQVGGQVWVTRERGAYEDVSDLLRSGEDSHHGVDSQDVGGEWTESEAKIHPVHLLPPEYKGLSNGHKGSHQFLIHEFVTACVTGKQPPNNVWQAARYLVPGLIAHQSALAGGPLMEVPDYGTGADQD